MSKYIRAETYLNYSYNNCRMKELDYCLWCFNRFQQTEVKYQYTSNYNISEVRIKNPCIKPLFGITFETYKHLETQKLIGLYLYSAFKKYNFITKVDWEDDMLEWTKKYNDYKFLPFRDFSDKCDK